jgi:hypothetical protein
MLEENCFNRLNLVLIPIATKVRPNSGTLNGSAPLLTIMGTTAFVVSSTGFGLATLVRYRISVDTTNEVKVAPSETASSRWQRHV